MGPNNGRHTRRPAPTIRAHRDGDAYQLNDCQSAAATKILYVQNTLLPMDRLQLLTPKWVTAELRDDAAQHPRPPLVKVWNVNKLMMHLWEKGFWTRDRSLLWETLEMQMPTAERWTLLIINSNYIILSVSEGDGFVRLWQADVLYVCSKFLNVRAAIAFMENKRSWFTVGWLHFQLLMLHGMWYIQEVYF
jgi:hypothetical protein